MLSSWGRPGDILEPLGPSWALFEPSERIPLEHLGKHWGRLGGPWSLWMGPGGGSLEVLGGEEELTMVSGLLGKGGGPERPGVGSLAYMSLSRYRLRVSVGIPTESLSKNPDYESW